MQRTSRVPATVSAPISPFSAASLAALAVALVLSGCGSGQTSTTGSTGGSGGTTSTGQGGASGGASGTGGSGPGGLSVTGGVATGGTKGQGGSGSGGVVGSGGSGSGGTTGSGGALGGTTGHGGSGGTTGSGGAPGGTTGHGGSGGTTGSGGSGTGGTATGGAGGTGAGGTGAGGAPAGTSAGCGKTPTIASSNYNNGHHIAITVGGMAREYILNVPTNYDNTHPYKFIIAYHELNGNDDEMYRNSYYHLLPLSNNSTIFVAPNGQQNGANCTQASGCGWPNPNDSDMLFADAVVAQIEQNFCVDTNRTFATGWSYGASMSYETACERPLGVTTNGVAGYIRAIAAYSAAQLSGSCKPTKPVAYYASHGTGDTVLCYDSTSTNCSFASAGGGVGLCENYAMVDGCSWMTPTKVTSGNHVCTNLTGCMTGYPVEFCSFNGPHTPDPTDSGQRTSWEYQNVWNFFSQF
jgi:poly(3-hydroxybutyrate) depolymerase